MSTDIAFRNALHILGLMQKKNEAEPKILKFVKGKETMHGMQFVQDLLVFVRATLGEDRKAVSKSATVPQKRTHSDVVFPPRRSNRSHKADTPHMMLLVHPFHLLSGHVPSAIFCMMEASETVTLHIINPNSHKGHYNSHLAVAHLDLDATDAVTNQFTGSHKPTTLTLWNFMTNRVTVVGMIQMK